MREWCIKTHWFPSIVFGIVWIENVLMTHSIKGYFSMEIAKSRWISINVIYYNFNGIVRGYSEKSSAKSCASTFKLMTSTWCLVTNHSSCKKMSKRTHAQAQQKHDNWSFAIKTNLISSHISRSIPSDLSCKLFKNHCLSLHDSEVQKMAHHKFEFDLILLK